MSRAGHRREQAIAPSPARVWALCRLARPAIWPVTILPLWAGYVVATHELGPRSFSSAIDAGLAVLVFGPLVWAAALAINDVADLSADRANPRKQDAPLVDGALSPGWCRRAGAACALAALLLAAVVGGTFVALTAGFLVLGWAYSAPPLRLKNRPGADVLANAVGVGLLPVLAGWSLAAPLRDFPVWFLPQPILVAAALYIPTTLVDHDADTGAGEQTFATRLGPVRAYRVGLATWGAANAGVLVLAAADYVVPRATLPFLAICAAVLVLEYVWLIGAARTPAAIVRGIIVLSFSFLVPSAVFAVAYVTS